MVWSVVRVPLILIAIITGTHTFMVNASVHYCRPHAGESDGTRI